MRNFFTQAVGICATVGLFTFVTGCQTNSPGPAQSTPPAATVQASAPAPAPVAPVATVQTPATPAASTAGGIIRIKAGASEPFKDTSGNVWLADQGFSSGETDDHPDLSITNTTEPGIYRAEHYSMDSFTWPLANGKYLVKLHFAETYDGIKGPGGRVFNFKVQSREFKDFDVWVKAGGPYKAYVESVPVEITDGKLLITFTSNVENPEINGIEIIPQP